MHQIDPESETTTPNDDSLYPYVNNDIKYGLFEDIVDSYYLDSQIKDDFQCNHDCYSHQQDPPPPMVDEHSNMLWYSTSSPISIFTLYYKSLPCFMLWASPMLKSTQQAL